MEKKLYDLMDWAGIEELVYSESSDPGRLLGAHPVERAPRAAKSAAALTAVAVTQYPDIRNADGLND